MKKSLLALLVILFSYCPVFCSEYVDTLEKSANMGSGVAQNILGRMYYHGQDVPQDYKKAFHWYTKAAKQGDAEAQNILGSMHYGGLGIPQDYRQAFYWFAKAAEQGNASAQINLGSIYFLGHGVPKNTMIAYAWINLAATQGNKDAKNVRDLMGSKLLPHQLSEARNLKNQLKQKIDNPQKQEKLTDRVQQTQVASQPVTQKTKLYVVTDPTGGHIRIMNIKEKYFNGIALGKGRYKLEASLPGHKTKTEWIDVVKGEVMNVTMKLSKEEIKQSNNQVNDLNMPLDISDFQEKSDNVSQNETLSKSEEVARQPIDNGSNGFFLALIVFILTYFYYGKKIDREKRKKADSKKDTSGDKKRKGPNEYYQTNEKEKNRKEQNDYQSRGRKEHEKHKDERHFESVFGLHSDKTQDDIKNRYRELVKQYHPDRVAHLGPKLREVAEQQMKDINEAYNFFQRKYGL